MSATIAAKKGTTSLRLLTLLPWANLTNWSVHFALENSFSYDPAYSLRPIGSFLLRSRNEIAVRNDKTYQRLTVRWYSQGIVLRDTAKGQDIGTKRQFQVKAGQFVLSRIDARFGALGMVPPEFDGAIITNDFPAYDLDLTIINPQFFVLVISTAAFMRFCQNCSTGTTNRQRLDEDLFLNVSIPIPPLAEQARLVAEYDRQMREAEQKRTEAEQTSITFKAKLNNTFGITKRNALVKTGLSFVESSLLVEWGVGFAELQDKWTIVPRFPRRRIGELCKVGSGGTPSRVYAEYYTNGTIPWVKTTEVISKVIHNTEEKITKAALANSSAKVYPAGSLIIAMYGQGATRGRTAKLGIDASTNQACAVLWEINNDVIETDFLWVYLMNEYERLRSMASGTNQLNLNAGKIYNYLIQVPPLAMQKDICADYYLMQHTTSRLLAHADTLEAAAKATFEAAIFA